MIQVNPLLAALTAAASGNASGSGAAAPVEGGLAALFGKLLAAAQAQVAAATESGKSVSVSGVVLSDEAPVPEGEEVVPLVTESDDGEYSEDGEVVAVIPVNGATQQPKPQAGAGLAALGEVRPDTPGLPVAQGVVNKAPPETELQRVIPIEDGEPANPAPSVVSLIGGDSVEGEAIPFPRGPVVSPVVPRPASPGEKTSAENPIPVRVPVAPPEEEGVSLASLLADDGTEQPVSSSSGTARTSTLSNLLEQMTGNASAQASAAEPFVAATESTSELARIQLDATPRVQPQVGEVRPVTASGTARPDWAPAHHASPDIPEVVNVRNIGDATIRSIRYLSGRTEETITVRLVPQSLGEMQIAVRSSADGMDVVLTTATLGARDAVEQQLHGLRDALARDGIEVSRVSVQTATPGDTGAHGANQQRGDGQASTPGRFPPVNEWIETVEEPRVRLGTAVHHDGTLDMRA